MQPVALQANKSLYSAQYEEIAKTLEDQVASGRMTAAEAQNVANKAFGMYMDPYGTMTSNNPLQQMVAINAYSSGNIDNPAYYTKNYLNTGSEMLSWAGGDSLVGNIIGTYMAKDPTLNRRWNINKSTKGVKTNNAKEQLEIFNREMKKADNYNTNTQKLDTALLNATADISEIKTVITDKGWEIGKVIVEGIVAGITAWLGTKIVGGSIGKALGLLGGSGAGGSGAGLLGVLGTGAAVVGLTVATIAGIGSAVNGEYDTISSRTAQENAEQLANSEDPESKKWATNSAWNKTVGDMEASKSQGWFKEDMANAWNGIRTGWANLTSSDYIHKNKVFWEWMSKSGVFSEGDSGYLQRVATYYLFDKAGSLASIDGVSKNDLQQFAQEGYGKTLQSYANQIVKAGWAPSDKNGNKVTAEIDWKSYGAPDGSYRYGLDNVPYDNYVANLHEGEAVLTASTANELRNLLDEYRTNNESMASLDAIVQQQTADLCAKIDEVITTVSGLQVGGYITSSAVDQSTARGLLKSSMIHMRSTKDALN